MFRINVSIAVLNEDGDIVNHKGIPVPQESPWAQSCNIDMLDVEDIKLANTRMNQMFMMMANMKDFNK